MISERTSEWLEVEPGEEKPFDFSSKGKMRHRVRKLSITLLDLSSRPAITHRTIGNSWPLISLPDILHLACISLPVLMETQSNMKVTHAAWDWFGSGTETSWPPSILCYDGH